MAPAGTVTLYYDCCNRTLRYTRPREANLSWWVRFALLAIFMLAVGTVYITNQLLSARFTQSTLQRAQLRLALYSGNMVSELQRNSIVPRLLASDAELIGALNSNDYQRTSQRLLSFVDEIGAAAILLLIQMVWWLQQQTGTVWAKPNVIYHILGRRPAPAKPYLPPINTIRTSMTLLIRGRFCPIISPWA